LVPWPYFPIGGLSGFWRIWRLGSVFPDFFHHFCRWDGLKPAFSPGFCLKAMGKAMGKAIGFRLMAGSQGGGGRASQQRQGQRFPRGATAEGGGGSGATGAESLA